MARSAEKPPHRLHLHLDRLRLHLDRSRQAHLGGRESERGERLQAKCPFSSNLLSPKVAILHMLTQPLTLTEAVAEVTVRKQMPNQPGGCGQMML